MPIKIFILEDEPLFRELLASPIPSIEDFELVGTAGDGNSALAAMKIHRPDITLMDLHLGDGPSGIEIGLKAQQDNGRLAIIVMTSVPQTLDAASVVLNGGARWSYPSINAARSIGPGANNLGRGRGIVRFRPNDCRRGQKGHFGRSQPDDLPADQGVFISGPGIRQRRSRQQPWHQ
ncbi:MAG: response regulator [Chloroflexi bacterium]|nr:response regulator [Chloroflexota bacterium]